MKKLRCDGIAVTPVVRKKTFLIMKISTALIFAACLQVSANCFGQRIALDFKNAPLEKIFREIQVQSGYLFIYNDRVIENISPVTIAINETDLKKVMDQCLKDLPLSYEVRDKTVIIKESRTAAPAKSLITISGVVNSEDEELLEGVTIRIKNSSRGAITDGKGEFTIKDVPEDAVLIITSVGFNQLELNANGRQTIHIRLKPAIKGLDETVVMAYGFTSQRNNTGSISKVKAETLAKQPVTNFIGALEGRVPGLFISQDNGIAGSTSKIELRGINSIANGNQPLFIVDGVPFNPAPLQLSQNISFRLNPLNSLNPADIESIEVLKDADATAIYGSRGGNGVILITTKKGSKGKISIDLNMQSGYGKVAHQRRLLNNEQYVRMRKEAMANDNYTPDIYADPDILLWDTTKNVDWQNLFIGGTANYNNVQLSLRQGSDRIRYLIGGNYNYETSVFPGKLADRRIGMHLSLDFNSDNKAFKTTFSGSYTNDVNKLINQDLVGSLIYFAPVSPDLYDAAGKLNWMDGSWYNPMSVLNNRYKTTTDNLIANISSTLKVLPEFFLKVVAGVSDTKMKEQVLFPSTSFYSGWGVKPSAEFGDHSITTWNVEPQAEYHIKIKKSRISLLTGFSFQSSRSEGFSINATGYSNDQLLDNPAAAAQVNVVNTRYTLYRYDAFFGRLTYNLDERYIINATARRDGSSRFGPDKRVSDFGSVAAAWIFSNEKFIQKAVEWLTYGKIRGSYGISGNDQIADYGYLSTYSSSAYPYNGMSGLYPTQPFNAIYSWEKIRKLELAFEAGLFKNRIVVVAEWYKNRSGNQLIASPLPALTGFSTIQQNFPAVVQNTGLEFEVQTTNWKTKNFTWTSSISLTFPKNKLVKFPGIEATVYDNSYKVGRSLSLTSSYNFKGLDNSTGLYQFEDLDKDGQISAPNDYIFLDLYKTSYGGLSNSFQYKNFGLDVFIQYVKQPGRYDWPMVPPGMVSNQPVEVMDRWYYGMPGKFQRYTVSYGDAYTSYSNFTSGSSRVVDASYIRLKNVSLNYSLGPDIVRKIRAQLIKVYVQGQNLWTVTKFRGYDPGNSDNSSLPPLRMITAGIQVTF